MKLATFLIASQFLGTTPSFSFAPQTVVSRSVQHDLCKKASALSPLFSMTNVQEATSPRPSTTMSNENNPRQEGLALMLDDGTRKSHSMAQNTQFVSGFFKGLADRDSYRALITSLYFVYEAMEDVMEESSEECIQALDYPELRRLGSLKKDMDFFYGEKWDEDEVQPSAAANAYVARIREIAETKPYLMVAHQYTRYLGDLFGGQMMGGMASRSLGLENGDGTAFYTFDDIPSARDFITEWYSKLNSLDLTEKQKKEIVDEANLVFELNIDVLQELTGSPLKAMLTLAVNSLKEKRLWPFLS